MNWHKIFPKIYIKVRPARLYVQFVGTKRSEEIEPKVAISLDNGKCFAVGDEAERAASAFPGKFKLVNGFDHPRVVIGDFDAAREALKFLMYKVLYRRNIVAPILVIHPPVNMEGGLSQLEIRALKDLCQSLGAREVLITEHDLSEYELLDIKALRKKLL